jgi:nitrate/nitrite-specific signal transduction histidine kinase
MLFLLLMNGEMLMNFKKLSLALMLTSSFFSQAAYAMEEEEISSNNQVVTPRQPSDNKRKTSEYEQWLESYQNVQGEKDPQEKSFQIQDFVQQLETLAQNGNSQL